MSSSSNSNSNSNSNRSEKQKEEACISITMHQPWASLLVHGIKRVEGRSWPSPITGRLWIHAASKVPDAATIKAMEDFYREIYAVDGITDLKFPDNYPVSKLVGCVEVVGCVRREELACWKSVPRGVRLEALTNFCWLCEHPLKLLDPLRMRGDQGVYNLERKIYEAAVLNLVPAASPLVVKFPLPDSGNYYSLRPGSLHLNVCDTKESDIEKTPSLIAAIAGAQAAAMQYSRKSQSSPKGTLLKKEIQMEIPNKLKTISPQDNRRTNEVKTIDKTKAKSKFVYVVKQKQPGSNSSDRLDKRPDGPSQL